MSAKVQALKHANRVIKMRREMQRKIKRETARKERREAKADPENAPTKRSLDGWVA